MNTKTLRACLILAVLAFVASPLHAATATTNNVRWTYTVSNRTATVSSASLLTSTDSIAIPSKLDGYPVRVIGKDTFSGYTSLKTIEIPNTVTSIGNRAFQGCGLTSLTLPESVTDFGISVFSDCSSLTSVNIKSNTKKIGQAMFSGCSKLVSVFIPNTVTNISYRAFENCTRLKSIVIPGNVSIIAQSAFSGCTALRNLSLPGCFRISEVFPSFYSSITNVTISSGTTHVESLAFSGCSMLKSITIPDDVTSIGSGAFENCTNLTSVNIEDLQAWCRIMFEDNDANPCRCGAKLLMNGEDVTELAAYGGNIPPIARVSITRRDPWNGKAYISFSILKNFNKALVNGESAVIRVTATDCISGISYTAEKLEGDIYCTPGAHSIVWDMQAQGVSFELSHAVFSLSVVRGPAQYCVISFSGGTDSPSHHVKWLAGPPDGGFNTQTYKTTSLVLRRIEPGTFMMCNRYRTTLTKPYYIGIFEVTRSQYQHALGSSSTDMRPKNKVNVVGLRGSAGISSASILSGSFMHSIRTGTGLPLDLPTEAQWEYASRAGTTSKYNNGGNSLNDLDLLGRNYHNMQDGKGGYSAIYKGITYIGSYRLENWEDGETTVGSYLPNAWGLYDMHGNLAEICLDWLGDLSSPQVDPTGPSSGSFKVLRGGSWLQESDFVSPLTGENLDYFSNSMRSSATPDGSHTQGELDGVPVLGNDDSAHGFRLAFTLPDNTATTQMVYQIEGILPETFDPSMYAVKFNANGGSGTMTNEIFFLGTPKALTANAFTRTGYAFAGWAKSSSGPKVYDDRQQVSDLATTVGEIVTLYAVWTPENYTITFDSAGGTPVASITAPYGSSLNEPANPTKAGLEFGGWFPEFPAKMPLGGAALEAQWIEPGFYKWTVSGSNATITGVNQPPSGLLNIPSKIGGYHVTSIGYRAFYGCSGLTSVSIPDSVTNVSASAFSGCSGIVSASISHWFEGLPDTIRFVGIPDGVTSIGSSAFRECTGLKSVVIPNSVTNIGGGAFYGCSGLTSVNVPESVAKIEDTAFMHCSGLTSITIPNSVTSIGYSAFSDCTGLTSITLPAGLKSIGACAFDGCSGLTSVMVPHGVESIGWWAFSGCSELTSVMMPNTVTNLGDGAFYKCPKLTSITVPDGVTSVGWDMFEGCSGVKAISLGHGVTNVIYAAFSDCSSLKVLFIPQSLSGKTGSWILPSGCQVIVGIDVTVEEVPVPKVWLYDRARAALAAANGYFEPAARATAANGANKVWECYVAGLDPAAPADRFLAEFAFGDNGRPEVAWTPDLGGYRAYAVEGKASLGDEWGAPDGDSRFFRVHVALPGGFGDATITFDSAGGSVVPSLTATVGSALTAPVAPTKSGYTFAGWSPAFPATMPLGGANLVAQWTKNYAITFDSAGGTSVASITAALGAALSAPTAPTRSGYTFAGWSPAFPATMPLDGATLTAQWMPKNYTITFDSAGGSDVASIIAAYGSAVTAPTVPTKQGYTFAGWTPAFPATMPLNGAALTAQWSPRNYTITFDSAGGGDVASITAAYGSAVTAPAAPTRAGYTFAGWTPAFPATMPLNGAALTAQWTPRNYTITFDSAGGSDVASITAAYGSAVTAPAAPTRAGFFFAGWSPAFPATMPLGGAALTAQWSSVDIANLDWTVSGNAVTITGFNGTPTGSLVIPATIDGYPVTAIGKSAFYDCSALTSVTIPNSVTSIGNYAFYVCSGLTSVTIPNSVTNIGSSAFKECSGLTSITIPDSVTSLGSSAFKECSGLTSIAIPNSVTNIGSSAFSECSGLTSITIPDSVTSIGREMFMWCTGLRTIVIGGNVTSIGGWAFYKCDELTSVTIPDGVMSIDIYAFAYCSGLTSITIPDSVTSIGSHAFYDCPETLFNTTGIPGVKLVDGWAVGHTSSLSGTLDLTGVRGIGGNAFYNCSGLTSVTIPNGVKSIGGWAFAYCSGLTLITIPDSVTSVESYAFYNCSNLATISIPASLQSQTSNWGLPSTCQIRVRN